MFQDIHFSRGVIQSASRVLIFSLPSNHSDLFLFTICRYFSCCIITTLWSETSPNFLQILLIYYTLIGASKSYLRFSEKKYIQGTPGTMPRSYECIRCEQQNSSPWIPEGWVTVPWHCAIWQHWWHLKGDALFSWVPRWKMISINVRLSLMLSGLKCSTDIPRTANKIIVNWA